MSIYAYVSFAHNESQERIYNAKFADSIYVLYTKLPVCRVHRVLHSSIKTMWDYLTPLKNLGMSLFIKFPKSAILVYMKSVSHNDHAVIILRSYDTDS